MKSQEILTHYQCEYCSNWWSVGDKPADSSPKYCPFCGERLEKTKPLKKINWHQMPKDTLVEVSNDEIKWHTRYFSHCIDGQPNCINFGRSSLTKDRISTIEWKHIRLIRNPPQPWFSGKCPVPEGVRIKVWLRDSDVEPQISNFPHRQKWMRCNKIADIIAYQILGPAPGWE